jgi:hypothetical protein
LQFLNICNSKHFLRFWHREINAGDPCLAIRRTSVAGFGAVLSDRTIEKRDRCKPSPNKNNWMMRSEL